MITLDGVSGSLTATGDLRWSDGDIWRRSAGWRNSAAAAAANASGDEGNDAGGGAAEREEATVAAPAVGAAAAAEDAKEADDAGEVADASGARDAAPHGGPSEDAWQPGMTQAREERALGDWDASEYGLEYLSITKGELLQVQHDEGGESSGWAYGYSMQRGVYGWFPPTFSKAVDA
mmetsp:Transcript_76100/g.213375  ORF Transcript_76100/g.213375 Transcript_76100/m.213375 type:complete len:177 (-) Transcript_76100:122-652(-)